MAYQRIRSSGRDETEGNTALQHMEPQVDLSEAPDDRIWIQLVEPAATAEVQCISYCNMCL